MSRQKEADPKLAIAPMLADLLPWEREAPDSLRSLSVGGRELMISTCGYMAIREAEDTSKTARPVFRLINGGQA